MKKDRAVISILVFCMACFVTFHCNGPTAPFNNMLPLCSDIALHTTDAVPVNVDIIATDADNDCIGWKIVRQPALGSVSKNSGAVGPGYEFVYTSEDLLADTVDTIVIAVSDWMDTLQYARVNVIIAITAVDNLPVAIGCTTSVYRNTGLLDLVGFDPEGKPVTWKIITQPAHGSIVTLHDTVSDSLEAFYIPNSGSTVNDFFTFQVLQDTNASNIATVVLQMQNAYLLQQGVPFNGADYDGCEDTYLKVTYMNKEMQVMKSDSLTNFSEKDALFLNY